MDAKQRHVLALCCVSISLGCAPGPRVQLLEADDPVLSKFNWLVGHWSGEQGGAQIEEHWTHPAGGTMLGVNRTIANGRTVFFEYLRIECRADGVVFLAGPLGRDPPTPFRLVDVPAPGTPGAVFENPEHDFPQRISYWLDENGALHARIEGTEGGSAKSSEWSWIPAALPAK